MHRHLLSVDPNMQTITPAGLRTHLDVSRIQWSAMRLGAGLVCVGAIALGGCGDETLNLLEPRLVVSPEVADFGDGCIGEDNVFTLTLQNLGVGRLDIAAVEVRSGGEVFSAALMPMSLQNRDEVSLPVVFVPTVPKAEYTGTLVIVSNDPVEPELEVPLQGVGGIREIEVVPEDVDFGVVNEGLTPTRSVEIRNLGGDPLVLSSVTWTSTSADLGPVSLWTGSIMVPAKTSTAVQIQYAPSDLGGDRGQLVIESNDEDEPRVEVNVRGRANLAPRALAWICYKAPGEAGCPADRRARSVSAGVGRLMGLDGRDSFDPEGDTITYRWDIVEMAGTNRPTLFFGTEDIQRGRATGEVEVPQVGRYVLLLVARDERGLESFDQPESRVAILPKDLEIYLRWDLTTDVDLHLVRPGGRPGDYGSGFAGTSTGSDCSAFNRSPNWGDPALAVDNPSLERDVVTGRGPEVVSLDFPEDGIYRAFVHYCDSRNVNTNTHAFIEVFVRGALVQRVPVMDGARLLPGDLWEAAQITWDAGLMQAQVTEGTRPVESRPELCISQ